MSLYKIFWKKNWILISIINLMRSWVLVSVLWYFRHQNPCWKTCFNKSLYKVQQEYIFSWIDFYHCQLLVAQVKVYGLLLWLKRKKMNYTCSDCLEQNQIIYYPDKLNSHCVQTFKNRTMSWCRSFHHSNTLLFIRHAALLGMLVLLYL